MRIVLAAVIILLAFLAVRWVTREEDLDDEDLLDDEFLEENELGTVRYPGGSAGGEGEGQDAQGGSQASKDEKLE